MMNVCHHHNTQQHIHSPYFKQFTEYQEAKVLSCIRVLLLFILNDLLFSRESYQLLDRIDNIKSLDCVYLIQLICVS